MACSTCDYCYIPDNGDGGGALVECPDCHANAVRAWCTHHSVRLDKEGLCWKCLGEAARGVAAILGRRPSEAAATEAVETT